MWCIRLLPTSDIIIIIIIIIVIIVIIIIIIIIIGLMPVFHACTGWMVPHN